MNATMQWLASVGWPASFGLWVEGKSLFSPHCGWKDFFSPHRHGHVIVFLVFDDF
jgi:hypothetical protein